MLAQCEQLLKILKFEKNKSSNKFKLKYLCRPNSRSWQCLGKLFNFSNLLRLGDIEANPSPKSVTLLVKTYYARGLKNRLKFKRILNSCQKLIRDY
jgi:hypothetical protein